MDDFVPTRANDADVKKPTDNLRTKGLFDGTPQEIKKISKSLKKFCGLMENSKDLDPSNMVLVFELVSLGTQITLVSKVIFIYHSPNSYDHHKALKSRN
jgi:hypothetical protein